MREAVYADCLIPLADTPNQAESQRNSREQAGGIGLSVNADKRNSMCFKQEAAHSTVCRKSLKLVDQFPYIGSNISSTENDVNLSIFKTWTAIDRFIDHKEI